MRPIKFRAWDKIEKKWVYDPWKLYLNGGVSICDVWATRDVELCQFTGLLDRYERKIFEGDIVKFRNAVDGVYRVGYVKYFPPEFKICPNYGGVFDFMACHKDNAFEVIGNIYENPELLKEGK